jgi:hypothetical protein
MRKVLDVSLHQYLRYTVPSSALHRTAQRSSIYLLAPMLEDRRGSGNDRHNVPASLLDGTYVGHL